LETTIVITAGQTFLATEMMGEIDFEAIIQSLKIKNQFFGKLRFVYFSIEIRCQQAHFLLNLLCRIFPSTDS